MINYEKLEGFENKLELEFQSAIDIIDEFVVKPFDEISQIQFTIGELLEDDYINNAHRIHLLRKEAVEKIRSMTYEIVKNNEVEEKWELVKEITDQDNLADLEKDVILKLWELEATLSEHISNYERNVGGV